MKRIVVAMLLLFSISFADEVNSRVVVRNVDACMTIYAITYKGQEFLIITKGEAISVVPINPPTEKKEVRPIPAEATKSFKLD